MLMLTQDRIGYASELYNPLRGIETLSLTGAYTDYQHVEVEGGAAGTTFKQQSTGKSLEC